jgi:hypothetical protein
MPAESADLHFQPLDNTADAAVPANTGVWFNPQALPRAWIVHHVKTIDPLDSRSPRAIRRRMEEIWFPEGRLRDLRREAVVEIDGRGAARVHQVLAKPATLPEVASEQKCQVKLSQPCHIEVEVQLTRPGLVVLSDLWYPGWRAFELGNGLQPARALPVLRTNGMMRGVCLPAGEHRISFRYRPGRFYLGLAVSSVAWLSLILCVTWSFVRTPLKSRLRTESQGRK